MLFLSPAAYVEALVAVFVGRRALVLVAVIFFVRTRIFLLKLFEVLLLFYCSEAREQRRSGQRGVRQRAQRIWSLRVVAAVVRDTNLLLLI